MKYLLCSFILMLTADICAQKTFRGYPDLRKDGAVIFYLNDDSARIAALRSRNYTKDADALEQKAISTNKRLVAAFRDTFTFCSVYFIWNKDVDKYRLHKQSGLFLDDSLQYDPSIQVAEKNIMYANIRNDYEMGKHGTPHSVVTVDMIALQDSNLQYFAWPFPYATQISTDVLLLPTRPEKYVHSFQNTLEYWYYYPSKAIMRALRKKGLWEPN